MTALGQILDFALFLFLVMLLARLVVDWIQLLGRAWVPHGPMLVVLEAIYSVTDPPIRAIRRLLPPVRVGGMVIDLSFYAVLLIVIILRAIVGRVLL